MLKVTVTCVFAFSVKVHVALLPLHPPPDQPAKNAFVPAVAVSVTCVPGVNDALHVCPQLIPAGLLLTTPAPVPLRVTLKVELELNVAETDVVFVSVITHVVVPLHDPPHPAKTEFADGVAVSVTCVPVVNDAVQV
jgi:hypothetical protein